MSDDRIVLGLCACVCHCVAVLITSYRLPIAFINLTTPGPIPAFRSATVAAARLPQPRFRVAHAAREVSMSCPRVYHLCSLYIRSCVCPLYIGYPSCARRGNQSKGLKSSTHLLFLTIIILIVGSHWQARARVRIELQQIHGKPRLPCT